MTWEQIDFCSGNIYIILSLQIKNWNTKKFVYVGFCVPEMSAKFLDFSVVMDFDT